MSSRPLAQAAQLNRGALGGSMPSLDPSFRELTSATDDSPVVKLCDAFCAEGARKGWDLLHVAHDGHARSQVGGVWQDVMQVPLKMTPALIRRFKVVAQLDLIKHVAEQTGAARFAVHGNQFDIRISVRRTRAGDEDVLVEFIHAAA